VDDLVYTVFGTSDVAILALKKGSIDMFWWPIQPGYMDDLSRQADIRLFTNEKSALYFIGFNLRRPPFDDAALRRAVAYLIDKDFIVTDSPGAWHQDVFGGAGRKPVLVRDGPAPLRGRHEPGKPD
jgi:ABC-type oligopeptide transport system substrate-binding subunit